MSAGLASDFKVRDEYFDGRSTYMVAKRLVDQGGGGDWILAEGVWDDAGIWDDASVWKDAA